MIDHLKKFLNGILYWLFYKISGSDILYINIFTNLVH